MQPQVGRNLMEPAHGSTTASDSGKRSSNRAFGMVFAVVFAIIAIAPLFFGKPYLRWALAVAALFALTGWLMPALLTYPNRLWLAFGALLHAIVSPVMLAAIYYITLLPIGFVMRLFGKDF